MRFIHMADVTWVTPDRISLGAKIELKKFGKAWKK